MSQENVETIRTVFEIFNREGFEPTRRFLSPDVVWYPFPEWPGESEYHSPDGAGRLVSEWTENFEDYRWEVEELIDSGEAVVLLGRHTGRVKDAGTRVEQKISAVFTDFDEEGRTGRAWFFLSWDEAREQAASL
jgi:ketosteroid isomerase-like protein